MFFLCSFRLALFPSLSLSLFISPSVSLPSLSFIFLLVCSSYMGGVKLRSELSRNDAFFSARDHEKKRDPSKFDLITFSATVTRSKRVSPFRLFGLFFSFRLSFSSFVFSFDKKCVKEAAPFEREQRERAHLPSWCIFPNNKKSSQNTTTASEDVISIHTHTYTRHTKHIAILYDSQ